MQTAPTTFDGLPAAVAQVSAQIAELRELITGHQVSSTPEADRWLTIDELCDYLPDHPAKATVYGWVSAGTIPVNKTSKRLRFSRADVDTWIRSGRKRSGKELNREAEGPLNPFKK